MAARCAVAMQTISLAILDWVDNRPLDNSAAVAEDASLLIWLPTFRTGYMAVSNFNNYIQRDKGDALSDSTPHLLIVALPADGC